MFYTILNQWQPFAAVFFLATFWIWEAHSPFFARQNRVRHATRNLAIAIINSLLLAVIFAGLTVLIAEATKENKMGLVYLLSISGGASVAVSFLLLDFWMYWWHRLNHQIPFLWRFHRMHHSDPNVDVTTATRFHPGEIVLSSILRLAAIPLAGIPIEAIILFDAVQLPIISFHHANISLPKTLDRALRRAIVTPFMHKVHHSRLMREANSNFSSVLSIWDRLFHSFTEKEDYREIRFGLDGFDVRDRQSIQGLLRTPLF